MAQGLEFDLKDVVLSNNSFGPQVIEQLNDAFATDYGQFGVLKESVQELETREDRSPAMAVRLGVCYFLLGRYEKSLDTLASADGGALAHFYMGKCHFALERWDEAIKSYEAARKAGYDGDLCSLAVCEAERYADRLETALQVLDNLSGAVEQTAEYLYQRGATVSLMGGNSQEVVALYERAVEVDPKHTGALFGLARENDRCGNDDVAIELYQKSTSRFPANVSSLLNLGILYEDHLQFDRAHQCYQRILDQFPDHARARLYLKDASASGDMFYDEEAQRLHDKLNQVLNVPVSDFELSVRSRNCLQKMGVRTLGDLTRISESELLASKNFGETSLVEIREMLSSKGLELGQFANQRSTEETTFDTSNLSPDEAALLDRPIADLNLSVRARKCMVRLGLNTIGELLRKTGDDLLECKNFGVTSLNEVRERLDQLSLKLRGD